MPGSPEPPGESLDSPRPRARVLLAEDEFLVALVLEEHLRAAGYEVVGPFATLALAAQAARGEGVDAAVLDVNLNGEMIYPLADALAARGVPFALLSGYGAVSIPERFRAAPLLAKPHAPEALVAAVGRLVGTARGS